MKKVINFLLGESDLDGYYFGENPKRKPFFWRTHLRAEWEKQQARIAELEQREAELAATVERLRIAALNAISIMPSGQAKADLRDAFDDTPEQNLSAVKRDAYRQGFHDGLWRSNNDFNGDEFLQPEVDVEADFAANEYAERVKRVEVFKNGD